MTLEITIDKRSIASGTQISGSGSTKPNYTIFAMTYASPLLTAQHACNIGKQARIRVQNLIEQEGLLPLFALACHLCFYLKTQCLRLSTVLHLYYTDYDYIIHPTTNKKWQLHFEVYSLMYDVCNVCIDDDVCLLL